MNPVYLYVPNLIGYGRLLAGIAAFFFTFTNHAAFLWLYTISYTLDALDGIAARKLNQCSDFGAVLDMLTDRVCTLGLYFVLGQVYPQWSLAFAGVAILDIASHWVHTHSTLLIKPGSHKALGRGDNAIMRVYYTLPYFMLTLCVGQEGCLLALYALTFTPGWALGGVFAGYGAFHAIAAVLAPLCITKQLINVVQMAVAFDKIAAHDAAHRTVSANIKGE